MTNIDEKALETAHKAQNCSEHVTTCRTNTRRIIDAYLESAKQPEPASDEGVVEIKPCPYVNGFSSDNLEVSFILKRYVDYSDFILFEDGKPNRCFRFWATPQPPANAQQVTADLTPKKEYDLLMAEKIHWKGRAAKAEKAIKQVTADHSGIVGLLEPIASQDWHGKWRINKAIEIAKGMKADREALGKVREALKSCKFELQGSRFAEMYYDEDAVKEALFLLDQIISRGEAA